jgi:hypothetical protein
MVKVGNGVWEIEEESELMQSLEELWRERAGDPAPTQAV